MMLNVNVDPLLYIYTRFNKSSLRRPLGNSEILFSSLNFIFASIFKTLIVILDSVLIILLNISWHQSVTLEI